MGNKVVLIVKSWLLVCAKFYCLIYVTFWKGEVISLRGLACEGVLTALCHSGVSQQGRHRDCQGSALPSHQDALQGLREAVGNREKWEAVN